MALTKRQIVDILYEHIGDHRPSKYNDNLYGFSKNECSLILERLLEIMKRTLANGEDIMISGFGK